MIYTNEDIQIESGDHITIDEDPRVKLIAVTYKKSGCGPCYFNRNGGCTANNLSCGNNILVFDTMGKKQKNEGIISLLHKTAEHLQNTVTAYEKEIKNYQKIIDVLVDERNFVLNELVKNKDGKNGKSIA